MYDICKKPLDGPCASPSIDIVTIYECVEITALELLAGDALGDTLLRSSMHASVY